jgi:hypothetical protein
LLQISRKISGFNGTRGIKKNNKNDRVKSPPVKLLHDIIVIILIKSGEENVDNCKYTYEYYYIKRPRHHRPFSLFSGLPGIFIDVSPLIKGSL